MSREDIQRSKEFEERMMDHLIHFKEEVQFLPSLNKKKKWQYYDISDNLYPPLKHGFLQYAFDKSIPFHEYINHVRSSQVFGFNLFYPLLKNESCVVIDKLTNISGTKMKEITNFSFEYQPEEDWLGEWPGKNKPDEYVTSADLAIFAEDYDKNAYAFLIEVKFTELFASCNGAFSSTKGEAKTICESRASLYEGYDKCCLQIKNRNRSARTYFNQFNDLRLDFPGLQPEIEECPFKENHQCLRNHAFARALKTEKKLKKSFFGLVYHDGNDAICKEWGRYKEITSSDLRSELFIMQASELVRGSSDKNFKRYFKERYKIE